MGSKSEYDKKRYAAMSERERRTKNLKRYGLTVDLYDAMLVEQGGRCAICPATTPGGRHGKHFHVDHDHTTGKVRGLLCNACNTVLGAAADRVDTLQNAISYLSKER